MKAHAHAVLAVLVSAGAVKRSACVLVLALLAALCTFGCAPRLTYGDYVGTWTGRSPAEGLEVTEVVVGPDGDGSVAMRYGGHDLRCELHWEMGYRSLVGTRLRGDAEEMVTVTLADGRLSGKVKEPGPVVVDPRLAPGEAPREDSPVVLEIDASGRRVTEGQFAGFTRRPSAKP